MACMGCTPDECDIELLEQDNLASVSLKTKTVTIVYTLNRMLLVLRSNATKYGTYACIIF